MQHRRGSLDVARSRIRGGGGLLSFWMKNQLKSALWGWIGNPHSPFRSFISGAPILLRLAPKLNLNVVDREVTMERGEKKLFIWVLIFYELIFRLYRRRLRISQSMELET
jgi:hypothetical protein